MSHTAQKRRNPNTEKETSDKRTSEKREKEGKEGAGVWPRRVSNKISAVVT